MAVREYQKKRRRERIFRAAMELFRNRGFQETTATEIAKAAHATVGSIREANGLQAEPAPGQLLLIPVL
mgnify:CR=1 FL=1